MTKQHVRPIVSILMLLGFITILVTGLLSYVLRYNPMLSAIHSVFGLLFVGYGLWHIKNNFKPMMSYFKLGSVRTWRRATYLIIPVVVFSLVFKLPPVQWIVDAGYAIKEVRPIDQSISATLTTKYDAKGTMINVDVKAGPHYSGPGAKVLGVTTTGTPQMAIWAETTSGEYLETLYVTKKAATGSYFAGLFSDEEVRRPEALPHWFHSRGVASEDGLLAPSRSAPVVDALSGATPLASFDLNTKLEGSVGNQKVVIKMELNRSFDYNEKYHPAAYPNDPIYSGSGNTAQPSVIYSAEVDLEDDQPFYFMSLIGRGHHSGQTGNVYTDMSGLTTAKQMVKRAIIEIVR